jgi:flagellar motility protein MotE (MotC chaperone)
MIIDGKIEDVFDIILKLKEKKVTLIMKFLSVENASLITQMLQNYKINNSLKDDNG